MMAAVAAKAITILRTMMRPPACYRRDESSLSEPRRSMMCVRGSRLRAKISTIESIGQDCDTLK
jgi:hypothetical protein